MSTLTNSIVRGFGLTLGRKAANAVTSPSRVQSVEPVSFSKKQLELIQTYEGVLGKLVKTNDDTEAFYKDGKITELEYNILKLKIKEQMIEANTELERVKSIQPKSSSSVMKWILIIFVGIPLVLAILSGLFS
jgi:hypothetical protein